MNAVPDSRIDPITVEVIGSALSSISAIFSSGASSWIENHLRSTSSRWPIADTGLRRAASASYSAVFPALSRVAASRTVGPFFIKEMKLGGAG